MLFKIFCFISSSICADEEIINKDSFTIVFDRTIDRIVREDKKESNEIDFTKNDDVETSSFIWDQYFPKPLFYLVDCTDLKKSGSNESIMLECLSENKEMLCGFTIRYDGNNILVYDFQDADKSTLVVKNQDDEFYNFVLSSNQDNIDPIYNSLEYIKIVESLRPLYLELLAMFCDFTKHISSISELLRKLSKQRIVLVEAIEAERNFVEMTITIVKSLALLSIPSRSKIEFAQPVEYYQQGIYDSLEMIRHSVTAFLQIIKTGVEYGLIEESDGELIFALMTDHVSQIANRQKFDRCEMIYNNIVEKLEPLELIVQGAKTKNKVDTQITQDYDIKKVDEFVDKTFSIFYDYCEVMEKCDEHALITHYCDLEYSKGNSAEIALEKIFIDILMCENIKKQLMNYQDDKTDFLILTRSDYFKKDLSSRILDNIIDLIYLCRKTIADNKSKDDEYVIPKEDAEYLEKIEYLFQEWNYMLQSPTDRNKMTFETMLKHGSYGNSTYNQYRNKQKGTNNNLTFLIFVLTMGILGLIVGLLVIYKFIKRRNDSGK